MIPRPIDESKFLQIYFMGIWKKCITTLRQYNLIKQADEKPIVDMLKHFVDNHNKPIKLFKNGFGKSIFLLWAYIGCMLT